MHPQMCRWSTIRLTTPPCMHKCPVFQRRSPIQNSPPLPGGATSAVPTRPQYLYLRHARPQQRGFHMGVNPGPHSPGRDGSGGYYEWNPARGNGRTGCSQRAKWDGHPKMLGDLRTPSPIQAHRHPPPLLCGQKRLRWRDQECESVPEGWHGHWRSCVALCMHRRASKTSPLKLHSQTDPLPELCPPNCSSFN